MSTPPDSARIRRHLLLALAAVFALYLLVNRWSEPDPLPEPPARIQISDPGPFRHSWSIELKALERMLAQDPAFAAHLRTQGIRDVTVVFPVWLPAPSSGHLEYSNWDVDLAGELAASLQAQGFSVSLRPRLWTTDQDRLPVRPTEDAFPAFQKSALQLYEALARVCAHHTAVLVMNLFEEHPRSGATAWIDLLSSTRAIFPGSLAVCFSDSTQVKRYAFWDYVDILLLESPLATSTSADRNRWRIPPSLPLGMSIADSSVFARRSIHSDPRIRLLIAPFGCRIPPLSPSTDSIPPIDAFRRPASTISVAPPQSSEGH